MPNGTPMGPGFFIFFNNLDVSRPFKGFVRVPIFEEPKEEVTDLITIIFTFLENDY